MTFWQHHKPAILFTLKAWVAILVFGTLIFGSTITFFAPELPVQFLTTISSLAFLMSAPFVLIFGIIAALINKTDLTILEKKRGLAIVGIILGFTLIENYVPNSMVFCCSIGYLIAIPISIFYFKI